MSGTMERLFLGGNLVDRVEALERAVRAVERRVASGALQTMVDGWRRTDVAAGLSGAVVNRFGGSADGGLILPVTVHVRGLMVSLNAARTAGTLAAVVYVGGTATGLRGEFGAGNTLYSYITSMAAMAVAGEVIDIRLTTSGDWAPTSADLFAALIIEIA